MLADRVRIHPGASKRTVTVSGGAHLSGRNEGELVEQALRVLDDADHLPGFVRDLSGVSRASGRARMRPLP